MTSTMMQPSLFDESPRDWLARAEHIALRLGPGALFTVDALRDHGLGEPPDQNLWGQLTHGMSVRHLIRSTGRIERSTRPERRNGVNQVWEVA
jgi:hypothetical protein